MNTRRFICLCLERDVTQRRTQNVLPSFHVLTPLQTVSGHQWFPLKTQLT